MRFRTARRTMRTWTATPKARRAGSTIRLMTRRIMGRDTPGTPAFGIPAGKTAVRTMNGTTPAGRTVHAGI